MQDPSAAVMLIGDELLSGRTRDINLKQIADYLAPLGIPVRECRVVGDEQDEIVAALNALRERYTYVFTTGGIGPTHDDITVDAVAAAFGVSASEHPDAVALLERRYADLGREFTAARRRMTRIPEGASLVANPASGAPGFQTANVFTLAGVPSIARAMLEDIGHRLEGGAVVHAVSVRGAGAAEGMLADGLGKLDEAEREVSLGSYPWFNSIEDNGVTVVVRGRDTDQLERVTAAVETLFRTGGVTPVRVRESEGS